MSINTGDDIQFSNDHVFEEVVHSFEEIPEVAGVKTTEDSFDLLKKHIERSMDMSDADHQLSTESAVCKNTAEYISDIFGKSILGQLSLESFTVMPTNTNYNYLKRQTKLSLAKEQASAVLAADTFFNKALSEVHRVLLKLTEVSAEHIAMCNSLRQAMSLHTVNSTNLVVGNINGKYDNVIDVPIRDFSFSAISNNQPSGDMDIYHQKLQELVQYKHIAALCYAVSNNETIENIIENPEIKGVAMSHGVRLKDLFQFGLNTNVRSIYSNSLPTYATELCREMESLMTDSSIDTFEQASVEMNKKEKAIDKCLHHAKEVMAYMYYGVVLMKALDPYLQGMTNYTKK